MSYTYCFDLDGTLCTTEGTDYASVVPKYDRIELVNKLYNEGHTIIIETARGSKTGIDWYELTYGQLLAWGVKFHELRTGKKVAADFYIDDKGVKDTDFFS